MSHTFKMVYLFIYWKGMVSSASVFLCYFSQYLDILIRNDFLFFLSVISPTARMEYPIRCWFHNFR